MTAIREARAGEWQPIAEHDGGTTEVIGMDAKGRVFKTWFFAPSSITKNWHRCDARGAAWHPIYFMPLPPPPTA